MNEYQVAWPFTALEVGALEEFIDRWANLLAEASEGRLHHPTHMPERPPQGSWRQT
jgi:serine/threonine-protein kinase